MSDASLQHWREGVGAYNAGDIQRAIAQFKSAAPSKGVLFNLGVSTAKLGDNKTAIRHFDEVLRLDPNLGVAYLTRGACKHHEKMFDAAITDYDRALSSISESSATLDYSGEGLQFEMNRVDLLFNRALALKEVGRISEAQEDTATAKKLIDSRTTSRQAALDKLWTQLDTLAASARQSQGNGNPHPGAPVPAAEPYQQPQQQQIAQPAPAPPPQQFVQPAPAPPQQRAAPVATPPAPQQQQPLPAPAPPMAPAAVPAAAAGGSGGASSADLAFYPLEVLTGRPPFPDGVDPTKREQYLSDDVFQQVFSCTKDDFAAMPAWKRDLIKKKKNLF